MLEYTHEQDWKGRKYNCKIVGWKGLWEGSTVLAATEITSCESWVHSGRQQLWGSSSEHRQMFLSCLYIKASILLADKI